MPKRTKKYETGLLERLKDPDYAVEYLNAILEDDAEDAEGRFLLGLRQVANAQGLRMADLAEMSNRGRQALYRSLSAEGNPQLSTLTSVLSNMGFRIQIAKCSQSERQNYSG